VPPAGAVRVKPEISSAADLKARRWLARARWHADVALRYWLKEQGFETTPEGGGDVSVVPQENAQSLETFKSGDIVGAWVPEPWATRLIQEGGGKVLVDEKDLWPNGEFVTTHLIVSKKFLDEHPVVVRKLIEGQLEANKFVNENRRGQTIVNDGIEK
jgi:NitT/TauT family transport system substrate-binding protein